MKPQTYVGASVVAEWCGVARSTVNKWRVRHPSFPQPDAFFNGGRGMKQPAWLPSRKQEILDWHRSRRAYLEDRDA